MTKQFLLAAAPPPPPERRHFASTFVETTRKTHGFGALTAATETAIDDNRTAALSPRQSPLRPCPAPCAAAITRGGRTRITAGHGIAREERTGKFPFNTKHRFLISPELGSI